ncbi:MAG: 3-deoxy-D-manno-octulosonic acid transferase, partial [Alphaproteobacteria bacterium]
MSKSIDSLIANTALSLYRLFGRAAGPIVRGHLRRRAAAGREDPDRVSERLGKSGIERPDGPLVWVHGASVGESMSAIPLIERVRREWPSLQVLMTTGTVTSARLMKDRLPDGVLHQYIPVDLPGAVNRFLDHWNPTLGLIIESELWPNLLSQAKSHGTNLVLVNGRMSASSFAGWRRLRPLAARLLRVFDLILAQSPEDQVRFEELGARHVNCRGNLKFAAPPLSADADQLHSLQEALAGRPCWLAASTHPGEEEIIARVHTKLAQTHQDLLTIIAPRHPNRGHDISTRLRAAGHSVARRATGESPTKTTGIYVADTIGELGLWYRLCEIVLIGGSLV